jgi:hypothetical protein
MARDHRRIGLTNGSRTRACFGIPIPEEKTGIWSSSVHKAINGSAPCGEHVAPAHENATGRNFHNTLKLHCFSVPQFSGDEASSTQLRDFNYVFVIGT